MEKITGYTPGPWAAYWDDNDYWFITAADCPRPYIAATTTNAAASEANARLIALAPTLYEENTRLQSENERLREVLEKIANPDRSQFNGPHELIGGLIETAKIALG